MTSKNDDDIIDERSTWDHVTNEKIDEVIHLLNLQQKQHVMLSNCPFYNSKTKGGKKQNPEEVVKKAYDDNADFMNIYLLEKILKF